MSYGGEIVDFRTALANGDLTGMAAENKFGTTTNADAATATDLWDGANPTDDDDIWLAPTAARIHALVSSSDTDGKTGAPSAAGARTIRVTGLQDWDSAESSEDVTLDGTTPVNTVNSYVIVHRIEVLTSGASGPNVGFIDCTAAVDGTITAMILPGLGQTQMCVYGVPSTQTARITNFYAHIDKAGGGATAIYADITLLETMDVENQPTVFITKQDSSLSIFGTSGFVHPYDPYKEVVGPAILKMQTSSSAANMEISGGFGIVLVNK